MEEKNQRIINLSVIAKILWPKRKLFCKVGAVVFILSCIWIFPQPRYYDCSVALAPETNDVSGLGGIASMASSFKINIGGATSGSDAIYPTLYPDLFESPEFLVSLLSVKVETEDGEIKTDYYTYMAKHQKKNMLTLPFRMAMGWVISFFTDPPKVSASPNNINSKHMSYFDFMLLKGINRNIKCSVDKKTNVIEITLRDQDPVVCVTMADSVMAKLQTFIIKYRTSKARQDLEHYQKLTLESEAEYNKALQKYNSYCETHNNATKQTALSERAKLENEVFIKKQRYNVMINQKQIMEAKVQERTPAFTVLKSATVPVKPSGPKRVKFVIGMCIITFFATSSYLIWKNKLIG